MADDDDTSEEKKGLSKVHYFFIVGGTVVSFAGVAVSSWEKVEVFVEKKWGSRSAEVVKVKTNVAVAQSSLNIASVNTTNVTYSAEPSAQPVINTNSAAVSTGVVIGEVNPSVSPVVAVVVAVNAPVKADPIVREQIIPIPKFPESRNFEFLEARATGEGGSRVAAVTSALIEAVSMRLGSNVSAEINMALKSERTSINEVDSEKIRETLGTRYESATKGVVKWWDWEKEEYDGKNYKVTIVAVLTHRKPKSLDPLARKVVAVLPFTVDREATLLATKIDKVKLGKSIANSSSNYLVQGRKFAMVESGIDTLVAKAAKSGNDSLSGLIESAEALEADYILLGDAANIEVSRFKPGVGVLPNPTASGSINFRVVRIENRQTVLSRKFDLASIKPDTLTGRDPEAALTDAIGAYVSMQIHETVFPTKVLALNGDNEVVLNRGGDGFQVGDLYEIFTLGPVVKDPDTGESMQIEQKSGEVTITRVTPKMTYASITTRNGQIVAESLCRKK